MDYIRALEEERKKILVFERELPLSLQLVTQAIETCKKQQQLNEEITSEGPILEEFIPLRPSCSSSDEENNTRHDGRNCDDKKPDWLRSVQLWNQHPEPTKDVVRRPIAVNATRIGGAFHPFEREKEKEKEKTVVKTPVAAAAAPASSTTENTNPNTNDGGCGGDEKEKDKEGHSQRKSRRCWSPELHRRFLHALQQLGGSHVATPKQIRELMKVDGLTNDEVKSHLQKYRLHTRRPATPAVQSSGNSPPQQPHIVLVGGIWVPPPEYTAAAAAAAAQPAVDTTGAPPSRIYAPVASVPSELGSQKNKTSRSPAGPLNSEGRYEGNDNSEDAQRTNSDSPTTSASSSQTTTASPPFPACKN